MEKIIEAILNLVEPDGEINADSKLKSDCGLTSFDMFYLIEELSSEYNVTIDNSELKKCVTVKDLGKLFGVE